MTDTEKIKAEIERQSERNTKLFQDGAISVEALTARDSQLMIIRTFIESLEKEQDVDLEKEIEDYYHTNLGFILSPVDTRIIVEEIARHFYELGLNAKEKFGNPTIRGWVARDDDLNHIHLFQNKPIRDRWDWHSGCPALQLPDNFMPDLKWEDDPLEVELTIHRV